MRSAEIAARLRPRPRLRNTPSGLRLAVLPLAAIREHGLEWVHPSAPLAHPFDDGTAAVLERSIGRRPPRSAPTPRPTADWMEPISADAGRIADFFVGRPSLLRHPLGACVIRMRMVPCGTPAPWPRGVRR